MPRRTARIPAVREVWVATPPALQSSLKELRLHTQMGFDTEFVGEETYRPELCLIQVSTTEALYLIDPQTCGPLDDFWQLLHDPQRQVIVHAGREEIRMCYFASGSPPANLIDVQIGSALIGLNYPIGYGGLVQELLGIHSPKSETLTDWRRRPLTPAQMEYAYDDVRYLLPAWNHIHRTLKKLEREDWARAEFDAMIRWAIGQEPKVERWRKVKGIGRLNRRELAVIRAMHEWREQFATRVNRPVRVVLRDDVLIEIARQGSRVPETVTQLRGLPRNEIPVILATVRAAAALPLHECPELDKGEVDPPQIGTLSALLNVVLADLCTRLKLAPNLVASGQDLKELIRSLHAGVQLPDDSPFAEGWRSEAILPHLEAVLSGRQMIRVANPRAEAPLDYPPLDS